MVKKHLSRLLSVLVAAALAFASLPLEAVYAAGASDSSGSLTLQDAVNSHLQSFESYAADDEVEFIVELEGKSLLETKSQNVTLQSFLNTAKGEAAVNSIEKEQASVEQKMMITRSSGLEIEFTYKTVLNGFAVRAKYSEKERLESIPGVKNVYVAAMHEYVEPVDGYTQATHTSGALMDSDRANAEGYTGKGTVTAILDTGLDVNHSAFANAPEDPRYTQDDVAQIVAEGELNATGDVSALYKSEKIPFAYDYADKDNDVADSEGHGTHVTGSVGADSAALTGVAPDTQLMMMKVFSDVQSGASDTWVLAALEDCVLLDVDAINMSLGSAAGFTESDELTNQVYERVEAEGLNLLCAAGNDTSSAYSNLLGTDMNLITNPDNGVVGSPSTYNAALSVASINEESVYSVYFMAGGNKIKFNDSAASDDLKFEKALDGQTLEYVQVPNFGDEYDFDEVDVRGKIALVERGSIAFTEKEQNAYDAGAAGVIVYDNEEGELPNMQVNGLLPMIIVTKADGQFLRGLEDKTITVSEDFAEDMPDAQGGLMSDFSSLGVSPDLSLKPEITAPGGNVYSTLPGDTFGNMSGTSMASPHMAGAAAVMKQYVNETFPELSATEKQQLINQLMMSTAVPVQDEDGVYYTPRKQGAGLAQIYNAIHTGAYLTVEGCDRPKAELKDNENGTFSFTFTVHNMTDQALSYNLSAVPLTAKAETLYGYRCVSESSRVLPESEFTVSFSGDTVNVPANGTATVTVNMQLTEEGKQQLAEFTNGTFLDGFVMLDSNNEDGIDLSLPYLGFYGDWADAPIFDETLYDDGEASTYDMSGLYLINYADYTGYPLGINMITADMESASADKIAVASRSLGHYMVTPVLGMLRNSKEMTYTVTNQDGEVVFTGTGYNAPKSYYYANGDFFTYHLPSADLWWQPIYDGGDGYYYYLPDGDYTYTVTGRVDGEEETQSISFPIEIDNTAPEVTSHRYYEENGTPYLEVTVQDNHYIMAAQLVDTNDEPLSDIIATESQEAGGAVTYTFDLTAARASGVSLGKVLVLDYAQNMTESPVYSLISQNIDPMEVRISQQDLHFSLGAAPFQLTAAVYPEEAENKTLTWSSDDPNVATVSETGVMTTVGAGTTTIRATAYNGVQGTTTVTVVEPTATFPEDFIIREDGRYVIPADLNREVLITDNAHNVTLVGSTTNTKENPYKGLTFTSENTDLNLTIENLNVDANSSKSVVSFKGTGNTLVLKGENTLTSSNYNSKALIAVPEDGDLTVKGTGTLDLVLQYGTYGAGIGGSTSAPAGTITIDGGVINGTSYGAGALIGGAGSSKGGATVVVNGGTLDLDLPLLSGGYQNNSTSCGAGIGGGYSASSSSAKVSITINGGTITITGGLGAEGDGIDSNGYLVVNGGTVLTTANPQAGEGGIDSDSGIYLNGGTVIALGSRNDSAAADSAQALIELTFRTTVPEGSEVELRDSEGTAVVSFTAPRDFSSATLSVPELAWDSTYTLWVDGVQQQYTGTGTMDAPGGGGGGQPPEGMEPTEGGQPPEGMQPGGRPGDGGAADEPGETAFVITAVLFVPLKTENLVYLLMVVAAMLSGYLDDRSETPWNEYKKGAIDLAICLITSFSFYNFNRDMTTLSLFGLEWKMPPVLFVLAGAVLLWVAINSTNCTDGVDGLCGTLTVVTVGFLAAFGGQIGMNQDVRALSMLLIACILPYLWRNAEPCQMMMGDAGSRAFGLFIGLVVMHTGNLLLYIPFSIVMLLDGFLGIIKVSLARFLKIRIMKNIRTPLHDHVRKNKGWSGPQTVMRFAILQGLVSWVCMLLLR